MHFLKFVAISIYQWKNPEAALCILLSSYLAVYLSQQQCDDDKSIKHSSSSFAALTLQLLHQHQL